jgi:tetratricopeptide (TPR) repeat protein
MKRCLWKNFAILMCVAMAIPSLGHGELSGKEALALRRIVGFWKDGDLSIAKKQILDFLSENPESSTADQLHAMLGDLYCQEKKYQEAYASYQKIQGSEAKDKVLFSSLCCLFQLRDFPGVIELSEKYFSQRREGQEAYDAHLFTFEAYFRTALKNPNTAEQKSLAEKAYAHYQYLDSGSDPALLSSYAEVQRILQQYPQAISTYLSLAEKNPENQEEYLFQVARLQTYLDKAEAIKTFDAVAKKENKASKAAAFNELVLLFEAKRYEEFLSVFPERSGAVPQNKKSLLQLYLGKSHYALGHYKEATTPLLNYIQTENTKDPQMKVALICLIDSAYMTKNLDLLKESMQKLQVLFPKDNYYAQALLFRAHLSLELKDQTQASSDLQEITKHFPLFENQEELLFASAYLLAKQEKWEESRKTFLVLLEKFPSTIHKEMIYRHLVNCSFKLNDKPQLASHLYTLLRQAVSLSKEEKREFHFLLTKTLYDVAQYGSAIEELERYLAEYNDHSTAAEAHLLCALCHQKFSNLKAFIQHAEKALSLRSDLGQKGLLHLHLFNAYLSLNDQDNAAEHLLLAFLQENTPVKWENQLWLADYFYQKELHDKASIVFDKIIHSQDLGPALEETVLKYADLLHLLKRDAEKARLLDQLVHAQENQNPNWKYQKQALFELAMTYEALGEKKNALSLYASLINSSSQITSYIGTESRLRHARLEYALLKNEEKNEENPHFIAILSSLKELQIKKNIQSEPCHLEAALDYAEIRSSLFPLEQRQEKLLFFLNRMKEDFLSDEDIVSKEYLSSRKEFAEKDALFQTYMRYLEAKIMTLEGRREEAVEECQELAAASLHPYLKERIKKILTDE